MREFKSLMPMEASEDQDAEILGVEPVVTLEETQGKIIISYKFPGFFLTEQPPDAGVGLSFVGIDIAKAGYLAESGKPLLPSFGRYVQIPYDCDYTVTTAADDPVAFEDVLVFPSQNRATDSPSQEPEFEFEAGFYSQDQWYPSELVQVDGPYEMDAYNTLLVHVRPVQHNAALKRLRAHAKITVTISLTPNEARTTPESSIQAADSREAFGNLLLNPRRYAEASPREGDPLAPDQTRAVGPELLLVHPKSLAAAAAKLALWKQKLGLRVETAAMETIGGTASALKAALRQRRGQRQARLRYVLLLGDVDAIPVETIPASAFGPNATDYYYATSRDAAGPGELVFPWLAIGRIPVSSPTTADVVVRQIIEYEGAPPADDDYYRRMTFAAYFQDKNYDGRTERNYVKTLETIRDHLLPLGFDIQRVYVSDHPTPRFYNDGTPVPPDVQAAMLSQGAATKMLIDKANSGQLIMAHRDHGMQNGWHQPAFTTAELNSVTSTKPSLFYSVNCLTGQFCMPGTQQCFAEKVLTMPGTAPSLIAATEVSNTWLNDALMRALFDALWAGVIPTFPGSTASYPIYGHRLGDILNYAKSYLPLCSSGSKDEIKDHFEIYHVVGDPTLALWTKPPRDLRIDLAVNGQDLYVTLSDCPTGAVVTLWRDDDLVLRLEPQSTQFKVSLKSFGEALDALKARRLSVCVFAPEYRFVQQPLSLV